ncbi:mitochondrial import inner membrane translocase subunit Tim54 [Scheffersomyces coipomensis]|uniref:mitochondrial import inner membrane translocase subunit Tim54 n=1 Tax=Scheffersomyces coipomensis TaxID=1788519 RepID=UPI00315DD41C
MTDSKPDPVKTGAEAATTTTTPPPPDTKTRPPKKGWSNPALRMMGIPRISLPSRNWLIFGAVVFGIGGGIAYDKYQQSQIRKKYVGQVEYLSQVPYANQLKPRKVTVFIAPPPNSFLDDSVRIFRKFVKPILNAAAIDFQIVSEGRQGEIRHVVAKKIRELRIAASERDNNNNNNKSDADKVKTNITNGEETVSKYDLYGPTNVLGLYKVFEPVKVQSEDELNPNEAGGIICIGRGAFKEYITGVHEGLLGPLEKPQSLIDEENRIVEEKQAAKAEAEAKGETYRSGDDDDDDEEERTPVTKPFITSDKYGDASFAPEFLNVKTVLNPESNIPAVFEQPVYVFPVPKLTGFLKTPQKIYRYYTTRYLADDYGSRTLAIINDKIRDYQFKDTFMAKEEEIEWPKKWVEKGKEKNSEWVQELTVDDRVISRMRVYDPEL